MSVNPYAPPKAHVEDVDTQREQAPVAYFPVSPLKLVALSICTLNLYEFYWFYKNWMLIKTQEKSDLRPFWGSFWRSFFSVFYCYSCYQRMSEQGVWNGLPRMPAGALAAAWIVARFASRLPEPYSLLTFLSPFVMIPAQLYANRLNAILAPGHDPNDRFTAWNWVAIALGGPFVVLVIVVLFFPEEFATE